MQLIHFLQTRSQRFIITLGALFLVFVGTIDWLTGSELSISVFYLLPIVLLTWLVNRRVGILACFAGALIWMIADLAGGRVYSVSVILYWNAAVRLGFFLIVTLTLSAQRAAQLLQEELAHFVVHDLRSPISNVLSGLQYLDAAGDDMDANERQEVIQSCVSSCNRTLTLINSLLDLARLESGKMELNIQETDVSTLFNSAFQQIESLAARSAITVTKQVDAAVAGILVDAEITTRVLVNLMSNAIKYSTQGTTVVVAAKPSAGDMVAISVADTGVGIPDEWKTRIFDKFVQVEARGKGIEVGSGLGLSFCKLAVQGQGGRIWVESQVGQGTIVIFTAPKADRNSA